MSGRVVRRYGRRLFIVTGRLGIPLGFRVQVDAFPRYLTLGVWTYTEDDDGDGGPTLAVGLLVLEVRLHPLRYLTKRRLAAKRAEAAARWAPTLIEEVEEHLRGQP
jgi:hypothetical protein